MEVPLTEAIERKLCNLLIVMSMILMSSTALANKELETNYKKSIDEIGLEIKKLSNTLNANRALLKTEQDRLTDIEQRMRSQQKKIKDMDEHMESIRQDLVRIRQEKEVLLLTQASDKRAYAETYQSTPCSRQP